MFNKINLVAGILALLFFAYAQSQGWNMFENTASSSQLAGGGGGGGHIGGSGGHVYHK